MDMDDLDNKMLTIAIPQQISRCSRKISDRKDWKAREWENFVLYYSSVIFSDLLSPRKMKHWLLFVKSLYTILLDKINFEDLNRAGENLHTFVSEIESERRSTNDFQCPSNTPRLHKYWKLGTSLE
ncbi:hypothetical protein TKK_0004177 [Trichogramma kaykai]